MEGLKKVEWDAPQSVTAWQKNQVRSLLLNLWLFTTKYGWPLWVLGLAAAWIWGPQAYSQAEFTKFFKSFFLLGLFFPTGYSLLMCGQLLPRLISKRNDRYELNEKGLFCHSHSVNNGVGVSWKRLNQFRFADHPELPNVRVFEFTVMPIKYLGDKQEQWSKFYFSPAVVSETTLQSYIEQHAPKS